MRLSRSVSTEFRTSGLSWPRENQPLLFSFCWLTKVDGGFLPHWMDVHSGWMLVANKTLRQNSP